MHSDQTTYIYHKHGLLLWLNHFILQHQSSNAKREGRKKTLSIAEKKIIMVFVSFIVFGVYTMIHSGIVTGNADKATRGFTEYFICESTGHEPGKCDRSIFERHLFPYMSVLAYVLIGTIPTAILNFVVNWQILWKSIKKQLGKFSTSEASSSQVPTSSSSLTTRFSFDRLSIRSINFTKQSTITSLPPTTPV